MTIRINGWWAALNGVALVLMLHLVRHAHLVDDLNGEFDPLLESGRWAVRFLLVCLAMTPLNTVFGWRRALRLRKPAGLWAFGFATLHFAFQLLFRQQEWLRYPIPDYVAGLGVAGLIILSAMAATSNRWAMKRLGRNWKRLHRLVYAAGVIVLAHALLEMGNTKRTLIVNPGGLLTGLEIEIRLYIVLLGVLLALRIPAIRAGFARFRPHWHPKRSPAR